MVKQLALMYDITCRDVSGEGASVNEKDGIGLAIRWVVIMEDEHAHFPVVCGRLLWTEQ